MGWTDTLRRLTGSPPRWQSLPTADYYLLGSIGDLVSADGIPGRQRSLVQFGQNTWAYGRRLIIVRYATPQEMSSIEAQQWASVHYIIDDLIPAAATSFELPMDYREKLGHFARTILPRILALRPVIVAPSEPILALFPGFERRRLDPCWPALGDLAALARPARWHDRLDIAFLGTRSHAGTLPLLDRIAARLEQACPQTRLHVFFGRHLPSSLARRAGIVNHAPIAWSDFPAFCQRTKFHIGLAPVQDTPFARARSITKVMDHAAVGAVGIYSDRAPFAGVITPGRDGLLVGDSAEAWAAAILDLASAPRHAADIARAGADLAARLGDPRRARGFWQRELGMSDCGSN